MVHSYGSRDYVMETIKFGDEEDLNILQMDDENEFKLNVQPIKYVDNTTCDEQKNLSDVFRKQMKTQLRKWTNEEDNLIINALEFRYNDKRCTSDK